MMETDKPILERRKSAGNAYEPAGKGVMVLKLKKEIKKQLKKVCKQTEKLYGEFGAGESSGEFDTNAVLIRMDKLENELKALKEAVNQEKKKQYLERMGRTDRQQSLAGERKYTLKDQAE